MADTSFSFIRLMELRLRENSNKGKQIMATALALISIFVMCAMFVPIQIGKAFSSLLARGLGLPIMPTLGLALLLFGAVIHLIALIYALFVAHNLRSTAIIAIFVGFWALLGLGSMTPNHHALVQVLAWVELGMMVLISLISHICFKKERNLWLILQIGLVGAIFLLWVPKASLWIGVKQLTIYNILPGLWIFGLGIWAAIILSQLLKKWMQLQEARAKLIEEYEKGLQGSPSLRPSSN